MFERFGSDERKRRRSRLLMVGLVIALGCSADGSEDDGPADGASSGAMLSSTSGAATSVDPSTSATGDATGIDPDPADDGTSAADSTGSPFDGTYFEMLVMRPEHFSSTDLGSPEAVDSQVAFSDPNDSTTKYDPEYDAAKFIVPANSGSIVIGDKIIHTFDRVGSGNLLFFWEARADSYWSSPGDVDGVETHKAFQLSDAGDLALEPRFRFAQAEPPYFARADVRVYGDQSGVEVGAADSVAPQAGEFEFLPETWTRFWVFVDFDGNQLSYWVGDEERPVVTVLDAVPFDWLQNYGDGFGFDEFWFEFNTSQSRDSSEEPCFWGRNLAILRDVDDPAALVALGSV